MTSRVSNSCVHTASSIKTLQRHNATYRVPLQVAFVYHPSHSRHYAQPRKQQSIRSSENTTTARSQPTKSLSKVSKEYSSKSAFEAIQSGATINLANPPNSALSPPLVLPVRKDSSSTPAYLFQLGKTYGRFYKDGIKAVWFNYKAAGLIKKRVMEGLENKGLDLGIAAEKNLLSRAEYQIVLRSRGDVKKLPLFSILVLAFGEWLPLLVPYIPSAVPAVCRIPKQVESMRSKQEERRRIAFRQGLTEVSLAGTKKLESQIVELSKEGVEADAGSSSQWPLMHGFAKTMVSGVFNNFQRLHISSSLNEYSRLWDRLQVSPPGPLLVHRLGSRLKDVAIDDYLLLRAGGASKLSDAELALACEERGLDVLLKERSVMVSNLDEWLKQQQNDQGRGRAMMLMLFRRPNAWK